ncbi:DUF4199 domain-containing protein [uncultured Croceitalea sp.]|uniref:DUF4199 domain-containing protein n=1 Tax=uncultured Croceitalea sp. TaxID=1798908 RepID=UPI00330643E3
MEENNVKTGKFALQFGAIAGLVGIIFGVMLFSMDMHYERSFAVQAIQFTILAVFAVIGIVQFKKANGSYLTLGQALKIGAGVGLISAVIGIIYFLVLSNVIEPDYMEKATEIARVQTFEENPKMTQEQWDQGVEFQNKFFPILLGIGIIFSALFGLVVGLITGLITKKDKPAY